MQLLIAKFCLPFLGKVYLASNPWQPTFCSQPWPHLEANPWQPTFAATVNSLPLAVNILQPILGSHHWHPAFPTQPFAANFCQPTFVSRPATCPVFSHNLEKSWEYICKSFLEVGNLNLMGFQKYWKVQKCVTILKFRTKLKSIFLLLGPMGDFMSKVREKRSLPKSGFFLMKCER